MRTISIIIWAEIERIRKCGEISGVMLRGFILYSPKRVFDGYCKRILFEDSYYCYILLHIFTYVRNVHI